MRYILALAASGVGLAFLAWQLSPGLEPAEPTLSVDEDDLNLGHIWAQKELQSTIHFRNSGKVALEVLQLSSTCQCTSIVPETFIIPSGESREVALTLDVVPQSALSSNDDETLFEVDFLAKVAGNPPRQMRWRLSGFVRFPVYFSVPELFFGEEANQPTPVHTFETQSVAFTAAVPIRAADVEVDPPHFATANIQLETRTSGVLKVTPAESLEEGPFRFNLVVNMDSLDSDVLPPVILPVHGICIKDIYADPPLVMVGPTPIGEAINATIVIRSRVGRKFVVQGVRSATAGFTWDYHTRGGSESAVELDLSRQIEHMGLQTEELSIEVLPDGCTECDVLRIPVKYIGVVKEQTGG